MTEVLTSPFRLRVDHLHQGSNFVTQPAVAVPPFLFTHSAKLLAEENAALTRHLLETSTSSDKRIEFVDSPLPDEVYEELAALQDFQVGWISSTLGIDITQRRVPPRSFSFFRKRTPEGWRGFTTQKREVFLSIDNPDIYATAGHENIHTFSAIRFHVEKDSETKKLSDPRHIVFGYHHLNTDAFDALDEATAEAMNLETLSAYNHSTGKDYLHLRNSFVEGVIFFDLLHNEVAERLKVHPEDVRDRIYTGQLLGDFSALDVYNQAFGPGTRKKIASMKAKNCTEDTFIAHLNSFGIDPRPLVDALERYDHNLPITILGSLEVSKGNIWDKIRQTRELRRVLQKPSPSTRHRFL